MPESICRAWVYQPFRNLSEVCNIQEAGFKMNLSALSLSDMFLLPGIPKLEEVKRHGRALTFDEVAQRVGQFVIYNASTENLQILKRVLITRFDVDRCGEQLINFRYDKRRNNIGIVRRYNGVGVGCVRKAIFYEDA